MSDLFNFPSGASGQSDEGIFNPPDFLDLGSISDEENPFADFSVPVGVEPAAEVTTTAEEFSPQAAPPAPQEPPQEPPQINDAPVPASNPKAVSKPKAQPKTPPISKESDEEIENPLMAAMQLQEEKNERKAAEPVFAQLPVFSYNGNTEPIENTEQTFDELRLAKVDDFPEMEEFQSVSWKVTYGKITKNIDLPKKKKIGEVKREIETSKEFMAELKKSKDKNPKCTVIPIIKMQKKGECSYKGLFLHLTDARASNKTICFIPAEDGRVYERRITGAGEFITPAENVTLLDHIRAGFSPALPRIPYALMEQARGLFRSLMDAGYKGSPVEALVHIYWDKAREEFFIHVPNQTVGKESVEAVLGEDDLLDEERYLHYADLHSHNDMPAKFSKTDDRDERANRIYMVMGRLDRYYPELSVRICNGGRFCHIPAEQVIEPMPDAGFPVEWLDRIQVDRMDYGGMLGVAA